MKKIAIIIPFLNEAESIPSLLQTLNTFFADPKPYQAEVIFVNDGSSDDSAALLKSSASLSFSMKLLSLSKNYGSHAALRAGIAHAEADYICFQYADLQDPLTLIDQMFESCEKGSAICWAKRNSSENALGSRWMSAGYASLMRRYVASNYPEQGFDIAMFSSKVQYWLNQNIEGNSSIFLQLLTLGFKQSEVFYHKSMRKTGVSKWTFSRKIKLFIDSFVAFSYAPIRLVTIVGFGLFIAGIAYSSYLIGRRILFNDLLAGWPVLLSILMIGFGITNISIGILAEYLWRTLDSTRNRPVFIVDEITEKNKHV